MNTTEIKSDFITIIDCLMKRYREFTVMDVAAFKMCLLSLGVLAGTYLSRFFKKLAPVMWLLFLVSYIFVIYRLFVKPISSK